MESLRIRPATIARGDNKLLTAFFDSQLAWLPTVGSDNQWGSETRSGNEKTDSKMRAWISNSEKQQQESSPFDAQYCRAFIAEARLDADEANPEILELSTLDEDTKTRWVHVAGLVLEGKSAEYVRPVLEEQSSEDPFVYLTYLISDRRTKSVMKGVGAALISYSKEETRKAGLRRLCVDCWAGNDRRLVKYYESQGFTLLDDFVAPIPDKDGWHGAVLDMHV